MSELLGHPLILFFVLLIIMPLASWLGLFILKRKGVMDEETLKDFGIVQAASLTLLALLIGFSFSFAVNRYDQRKDCESEEANAIGTEYLRTDLLSAENATVTRNLLKQYIDLRIDFYQLTDKDKLAALAIETAKTQDALWKSVKNEVPISTTPVTALAISGMNDVINTQGYSQAAWIKHFPASVWLLLIVLSVLCNILISYGSHTGRSNSIYLFILPVLIATSLAIVADIASPRGGLIRIEPLNLMLLKNSL